MTKKYGFWFPKTGHSLFISEGMSEAEKKKMYHTKIPHYCPLDFETLLQLLYGVKFGSLPAGEVFFWRIIAGIPGMTSPSPSEGPVYEKVCALYQVYLNEVIHGDGENIEYFARLMHIMMGGTM